MSQLLGSYGRPSEAVADTVIDYFGVEFAVHDEFGELAFLEWFDARNADEGGNKSNMSFIREFCALAFGESAAQEFWKVAKRNRQTLEDINGTLTKMMEDLSGRPTGRPSDSSDGQQLTGTKSEGVSSSVLAELEGRPDLQLVVVKAHEARAS